MDKILGSHLNKGVERINFLKDNCDKIEERDYMKPFEEDELFEMKDELSTTAIKINDIEEEMKAIKEEVKLRMKPLVDKKKELLIGLKNKHELVEEECFKFIDQEERMTGWYNKDGELIESRPSRGDEMQGTIFQAKRTGTND